MCDSTLSLIRRRLAQRTFKRAFLGALSTIATEVFELSTPHVPVYIIGAIAIKRVFKLCLHTVEGDDNENVDNANEVARLAAVL